MGNGSVESEEHLLLILPGIVAVVVSDGYVVLRGRISPLGEGDYHLETEFLVLRGADTFEMAFAQLEDGLGATRIIGFIDELEGLERALVYTVSFVIHLPHPTFG